MELEDRFKALNNLAGAIRCNWRNHFHDTLQCKMQQQCNKIILLENKRKLNEWKDMHDTCAKKKTKIPPRPCKMKADIVLDVQNGLVMWEYIEKVDKLNYGMQFVDKLAPRNGRPISAKAAPGGIMLVQYNHTEIKK